MGALHVLPPAARFAQLLKRGNGLFGSARQTGSLGVVTINCARLGYLHAGSNPAAGRTRPPDGTGQTKPGDQRKLIQRLMDQGLFSYTKRYLGTLRNHFSTLGSTASTKWCATLPATRARHHQRARPPTRRAPVRPCARAHDAVQGRPPLQPGGHARRRHHHRLPKRDKSAGPPSCRPERQINPTTNSSQLPVGWTDDPSRPWRARRCCRANTPAAPCCTCTWASGCRGGAACRDLVKRSLTRFRLSLHHHHAHVLHLPHARLPGGRAQFAPPATKSACAGGPHWRRDTHHRKNESNWPDWRHAQIWTSASEQIAALGISSSPLWEGRGRGVEGRRAPPLNPLPQGGGLRYVPNQKIGL